MHVEWVKMELQKDNARKGTSERKRDPKNTIFRLSEAQLELEWGLETHAQARNTKHQLGLNHLKILKN